MKHPLNTSHKNVNYATEFWWIWFVLAFKDVIDNQMHFALCKGEISGDNRLVRRTFLQKYTKWFIKLNPLRIERSMSLPQALKHILEAEGGY